MRTQLAEISASADHLRSDLLRFGFQGPIPLLSPAECTAVEQAFAKAEAPRPLTWFKGHAATNALVHEVATHPEIIARLQLLLGNDIVLWGAGLIRRLQNTRQVWHSDMETADPHSRAMSVWIGLRNASDISGLRFVTGSHRFGRSAQEVMAGLNVDRFTLSNERMLEIARTMDSAAQIAGAGCGDGDMVLFDGRLWHSGHNEGTAGTRTALLLQYAAADNPIPMPENFDYSWPWKVADSPRVPTVLVSGSARNSPNRIVPAPMRPLKGVPMAITTVATSVALPLAEGTTERWRTYPQFSGQTSALRTMTCDISVLSPGHRLQPACTDAKEELLVMLDGEAEIEWADDPDETGNRHPMKPGIISYCPATQHHTIHNVSIRPATYLTLRWRGGVTDSEAPLPASTFERDVSVADLKPIARKPLFEQATHTLNKLHAHLTTLQPGAGYAPHADAYDVAIVLLSGEIETIGKRLHPPGVIYYAAGELHGMKNTGTTPATYLVFEFHNRLTQHSAKRNAASHRKNLLQRFVHRLKKAAGANRR
ncbi:MAG TPA: phytanoyl-CoA dioxygenase family protein [Dongiaceae bacterium]|nr:phytanoyl-CoA dioxygenase family protein [Dongiaceae bacterium]